MYTPLKKLVFGAVCLLSAGFVAALDCDDNGPWNGGQYVGNTKPSTPEFCATKYKDGIIITGIEVWADTDFVHGLQFYYSDGTHSDSYGTESGGRHQRLDWDPTTDSVDQAKLWGDGKGMHLGRVVIHTKSGKQLDVGKDTGSQATYDVQVDSGILLGAWGNSKGNIDGAGFLFLRSTVDHIEETDVTFDDTPDDLNAKKQGLQNVVLQNVDYTNNNTNGANETYTFTNSVTKHVSKSYSSTTTNSFGITHDMSVEGKLFDLATVKSSWSLNYQYSKSSSEDSTSGYDTTLSWSVLTPVKAGDKIYCRAVAMEGNYDGDYKSTVNVWLADGTKYSFASGGTMKQVQWSQASGTCQNNPFDPVEQKREVPTIEGKRGMKFIA